MMGMQLDPQDQPCILNRDRSLPPRSEDYLYGIPAGVAAGPVACINKHVLTILPFQVLYLAVLAGPVLTAIWT